MESTQSATSAHTHSPPRAKKTTKTTKAASSIHPPSPRTHATRDAHAKAPRAPAAGHPHVPLLDADTLEGLHELSTQKLRALVRAQPLAVVGGAFATGYVVGGGWRTRIGRLMMLSAARYLAVHFAEQYWNA